MTDWRTMSVAVRAEVGAYVSGLKQAETATGSFGREVLAAVGDVERLERAADKLDRFGTKMTTNVTLPVGLAGAAAVKMANDFSSTFNTMQSLAGVTADEVAGLQAEVKALAGETAQSPQELAEALYTIRSSGSAGAEALEILDVSAKAAALGMGEAQVVADALTSILATYRDEGLTAAEAGDVLTASIAEGKAEADAMAGVFGRLLPVANEIGVDFDELGGALAYLTIGSGDASAAGTQLSGVLQKLLRPSQQGAKELESVGLSSEKLRQVVADQGLLPALQMLDDKLGGNSERLGKVFEDTEGLVGTLALLTNGGEDAAGVIERVGNSAGMMGEKFRALSGTDQQKLQQAIVDLQLVAIDVGEDLIPVLAKLAAGVGDVAEVFTSLPPGVQEGILVMIGFAATLGPIVKLSGNVVSALVGIQKAAKSDALASFVSGLRGVTSSSSTATGALGALTSAVTAHPAVTAAAVVGVGALAAAWLAAADDANTATQAAKNFAEEAQRTGRTAEEVFREQLANEFSDLEGGIADFEATFGLGADSLQSLLASQFGTGLAELEEGLFGTRTEFEALLADIDAAAARQLDLGIDPEVVEANRDRVVAALRGLREAGDEATAKDEQATQVKEQLGAATDETAAATTAAADAARDSAAATIEAADADRTWFGVNRDQVTAFQDRLSVLNDINEATALQRDLAGSAFDRAGAYQTSRDAVEDAQAALAEAQADGTPEDVARARQRLAEAIVRQSEAAVALAEAEAEVQGKTLDAGAAAAIQAEELRKLRDETDPLNDDLNLLVDRLVLAAASYTVNLDTAKAEEDARRLREELEKVWVFNTLLAERSGGSVPATGTIGYTGDLKPPSRGPTGTIGYTGDGWLGTSVAAPPPPVPVPYGGALVPKATSTETSAGRNAPVIGEMHLHEVSTPRALVGDVETALGLYG